MQTIENDGLFLGRIFFKDVFFFIFAIIFLNEFYPQIFFNFYIYLILGGVKTTSTFQPSR